MSNFGASFDSNERKIAILLSVCLLAVLVATVYPSGGHINVDEGTYHMMVRDFSATGELGVWNGYEAFPSPELIFQIVHEHEGRLVSQYPDVYTLLAAPFYLALGYDGLFLLSALSFAGVVGLTFWMARRLFGSRGLALNACLILALATYAWEYSQATLPHALSVLFVVGAASLTVAALAHPAERRSLLLALGSGLVVGLGGGVRLDVIFVMPALTVPYLFRRPWRPWHALACALGILPGIALLTVFNQAKFGVASPFSYGASLPIETEQIASYLMLVAVGTAVLAAVRIATLPWGRRQIQRQRGLVLSGLGLALAAILISPQGQAFAVRFADGLYQLLIDFRIRDLGQLEGLSRSPEGSVVSMGGLTRTPGGGMVYMGGLKKSLLQSCPYMVVLVVPLLALLRQHTHRLVLAFLFLVPASYVGVYAYFAWHGALAMNLRYFLPILPFTSILTAYAWREVTAGLEPGLRRVLLFLGIGLVLAYAAFVFPRSFELPGQEFLFLTLPMVLAGGLLALILLDRIVEPGQGRILRSGAATLLTVTLVWAGAVAFTYDLPRSFLRRQVRAEITQDIAPRIAPDSLFFVPANGMFYGLFERDRVRIATPQFDDYQGFEALLRFHLGVGRPVYAWLDQTLTEGLESHGLMTHLRYTPLVDHERGQLVQITRFDDG